MNLLELILALQVNDFAAPKPEQVDAAIAKIQECEQLKIYDQDCASLLEKYIHLKDQYGGPYVNYQ
jgi:hypothetical protein